MLGELEQMRADQRKLLAQRDEWRARAAAFQAELSEVRVAKNSARQQDRYRRLKNLVARDLHPDRATNATERVVRQEIFKSVWAGIEEIDRA